MGRKPLKPEHKRGSRLVVLLTEDELDFIHAQGEARGFATTSDYVRTAMLEGYKRDDK